MKKILIIGACGQIGVELTTLLRKKWGDENVIASDIQAEHPALVGTGPFMHVDATDTQTIRGIVVAEQVSEIYLLAALLSATGEQNPALCWELNINSLRGVLEIARESQVKVFWPSSIAVFGPTTPGDKTPNHTIIEPVTMYGITKYAGEMLCAYYARRYDVDVRSVRYPGLISHTSLPGGGTTDYAVDIFYKIIQTGTYECFLEHDTTLPMMYMEDALRATCMIMEAQADTIKNRMSYNIAGMSFSPEELFSKIQEYYPESTISYKPDHREAIARSWPMSIDDSEARQDWGWENSYTLDTLTATMITALKKKLIQ